MSISLRSGSSNVKIINSSRGNSTGGRYDPVLEDIGGTGDLVGAYSVRKLPIQSPPRVQSPFASGGNSVYTLSDGSYVHVFTSSGTFTVNQPISNAQVLVVAGGGGGGTSPDYGTGGGGGGGEVKTASVSISPGETNVSIGAGGSHDSAGQSSTFYTVTSTGGLPGFNNGINIGRSGGASGNGFAGGNPTDVAVTTARNSGGGGGASQSGVNATAESAGNGGNGISSDISGTMQYYGGGGGGGTRFSTAGAGGLGGGGQGNANVGNRAGGAGVPNTGGGGGGSSNRCTNDSCPYTNNFGGSGGSGIVIVRYYVQASFYRGPALRVRRDTDNALADVWTDTQGGVAKVSEVRTTGGEEVLDWSRLHVFRTSGTFVTSGDVTADVLVVAGGGGGGSKGNGGDFNPAGGGGGGEVVLANGIGINAGSVSVTVGNGGAASNGGNSSFSNITAIGGGKGGDGAQKGFDGGSGGGSGRTSSGFGASIKTIGFGNNGGETLGSFSGGAGGGGAKTPGSNADTSGNGAPGGEGLSLNITGTYVVYGSGGGGGRRSGVGGTGGTNAGKGGTSLGDPPGSGVPNTGSGGGGTQGAGTDTHSPGGSGGSGIVVVRVHPTFTGRDALSQWLGSSQATVVTWYDQSGSGNHATEIRGNPRLTLFGTKNYLYGTTADGLRFPSSILPSTYTLFHAARYADSGTRGRIFNGVTGNWLSGFHTNKSGVAYLDGAAFVTSSSTNFHDRNLIVSATQNSPSLYRSNGTDRTMILAFKFGNNDSTGGIFANQLVTPDNSFGAIALVNAGANQTEYTWTPPPGQWVADVLVVAGGGSGGSVRGGGGGAGGLLFLQSLAVSGTVTIGVGRGGAARTSTEQLGEDGTNSYFLSNISFGGGGGGYSREKGRNGGSGGGGGGNVQHPNTAPVMPGFGTAGQGNNGGLGLPTGSCGTSDSDVGAGGGGAGGPGGDASCLLIAGVGGIGLDFKSTFGTSYGDGGWFAGGGGGGRVAQGGGEGGIGGGGFGVNSGDAMKHTGGGGGGVRNSGGFVRTGSGGSGIVLVRLRQNTTIARQLSINHGQTITEYSDWIVHEVLVYNSTLPLTRILKTERALMQRYLGATDEIALASRTGARGLYGLRKLSGTWNGPVLTVTRSSDGQKADLYFDANGVLRSFAVVEGILAFKFGNDDSTGGIFANQTNTNGLGTVQVTSAGADQTEYTWTPPEGNSRIADVLIIGGGGGGGAGNGGGRGGGGAGQFLFVSNRSIGITNIIIGNGGNGNVNTAGSNGHSSKFGALESIGGGGSSQNGASGGGGTHFEATLNPPFKGIGLAGNDGGIGGGNESTGNRSGGGGGGAGGPGGNAASALGGNGGIGLASDISGTTTYYAGGGGGGTQSNGSGGTGGLGGGGNGRTGAVNGDPATSHTGGGGGAAGGGSTSVKGGNGGSGIVLIRLKRKFTGLSDFQAWASSGPVLENPKMTSNSAVDSDFQSVYGWDTNSGWAASASSVAFGTTPFWAFNNNITTVENTGGWHSATNTNMAGNPEWLRIDFPYMVSLQRYELVSRNSMTVSRADFPNTFQIQGSNDGTNWTTVDSRADQASLVTTEFQTLTYSVNPFRDNFRSYRILISGVGLNNNGRQGTGLSGTYAVLSEFRLFVQYPRGAPLVETWYDQSGSSRHATQSTVASRPILRFGNDNAAFLDFRTNRFFVLPDGTVPTGNSAYSFVVQHGDIDPNEYATLIFSGVVNNANQTNALWKHNATTYRHYWWSNDLDFSGYAKDNVVVVTYDGTTRRGYVNGTQQNSNVPTARNGQASNNRIGNRPDGFPLNGDLYYVGIFGTALSQSEVQSLGVQSQTKPVGALDAITASPAAAFGMRQLFGSYTGPVVRVRRSADNVEADVFMNSRGVVTRVSRVDNSSDLYGSKALSTFQGQSTLTVVRSSLQSDGTAVTFFNNPTFEGNAMTFNGTNQYGTIPSVSGVTNFTQSDRYSVACWFWPAEVQSDASTEISLMEKWESGGFYPYVVRYFTNLKSVYYASYNGSVIVRVDSTNNSIVTNAWNFVVGTFNFPDTRMRVYVNGSLNAENTSASISGTISNSEPVYLMRRGGPFPLSMTGKLAFVNIVNRELTAAEISRMYQETQPLLRIERSFLDNIAGAPVAAYSLRLAFARYTGPVVRVRRSSDNLEADVYANSLGTVTKVVPSTGNEVLLGPSALSTFQGSSALLVRTWYDQSGNGNHVAQTDNALQPALVGGEIQMTKFSGTTNTTTGTELVAVNQANMKGFPQLSIVMRVRPTLADSTVIMAEFASGTNGAWYIGTGSIDVFALVNASSTRTNLTASPIGGWMTNRTYNMAYVYDGAAQRVYEDGSLLRSVAQSGTIKTTSNTFYIGRDNGNYHFTGTLSDTFIYNTGLPAKAIKDVHETIAAHYVRRGALDDLVAQAPVAAYSLRLLYGTYAGPAVRVRRSADNVEADLYFDRKGAVTHVVVANTNQAFAGSAGLTAFQGASTLFVVTWYDQSGNGRHATQTNVSLQTILTLRDTTYACRNRTDGTLGYLVVSGGIGISLNQTRTAFMKIFYSSGNRNNNEVFGTDTGTMVDVGNFETPQRIRIRNSINITSASGTIPLNALHAVTLEGTSGTTRVWRNGEQILNDSSGNPYFGWAITQDLGIFGTGFVGREYDGFIDELIFFDGQITTSSRLILESL
jgi:hypothetical protein